MSCMMDGVTLWEYARLEYRAAGTLGTDKFEDWDAVFQPYVRVDRARSRGSGIGLFAARRLMDAMGGRVWLEPNGYGGSRFVVELPAG